MPEHKNTIWIAAFELTIALVLLLVVRQVAADEPVLVAPMPITPVPVSIKSESTDEKAHLPENPRVLVPAVIADSEPGTTTAAAAVVFDSRSGSYLYSHNGALARPIASLTKLVTALTWLDLESDREKTCAVEAADQREGSRVYLVPGDRPSVQDLLYFSLVGSANTETVALARSTGLGADEFAGLMNSKIRELGLAGSFSEPTGLSAANTMTAEGLAQVVNLAMDKDLVKQAVTAEEYVWTRPDGRSIKVNTTDILLREADDSLELIGGKTGYTPEAGYCFAGKFVSEGRQVVVVVLGARDHYERFTEAKRLARWAFESYQWDSIQY